MTHRPRDAARRDRFNGIEIVRLPCWGNRYIFSLVAMVWALLRRPDADVVSTTTFNAAPAAWLAGRLRSRRVVITVNETWIGKWRSYSNFPRWKVWLHEWLERALFAIPFDRYVAISNATSQRLRQVVARSRTRTRTIYYGFDPTPWREELPLDLQAAYDLPGRFIVLGYGRIGTSKGFQWLVDSVPTVSTAIPDVAFLLVLSAGDQYVRELEELKSRANEHVRIIEPLPFVDLVRHVRGADCVVVPSLAEGFGYTTLEAVAAGTPVVASNVGSIPEVIGGRYQLVEPQDASGLARALMNVRDGRLAEDEEPSFPWSESVRAYEALYASLTESSDSR
ncbi:MAG: hypothetical protein NVS2B3_08980 [Vulcanimicrobiaceae bacterium]